MHLPFILLAPIEAAVNAALRLDPDSLTRVSAIAGSCIAIELRDFNLQIYAKPTANGISLNTACDLPPDVTLSGTLIGLLRMAAAPADYNSFLASGEVQIHGNIELGRDLKALLQGLDLDWEELLSRYTGDILARPIGNSLRSLKGWSQQATQSLAQDLTEYLQEEIRLVPHGGEVAIFLDSVDQLRAHTDRLEARIQRLRQQP